MIRNRNVFAGALGVIATLAMVLIVWLFVGGEGPPKANASDLSLAASLAPAPAPSPIADSSQRVPAPVAPATPATAKPPRSFDEVYADILQTMSGARQLPVDLDAKAREAAQQAVQTKLGELFLEMATEVKESGSRAMQKLLSLGRPFEHELAVPDVHACRLILDFDLQVMTKEPERLAQRSPLVQLLLEKMSVTSDLAHLTHALLHKKGYLQREHEDLLKAMLDASVGDLAHLRPLILDLLLDLWLSTDTGNANLLTLVEGAEGAMAKQAALARLLLTEKYRELAMVKLIALRDAVAMDQASLLAARSLDASEALRILAAFKSTPQGEFHSFSGYSTLAERFPKELAQNYEKSLADGVMPAHRENAMQSLAHLPGNEWTSLAQRAFEHDPSARVKGVALLALAAKQRSADFERAFDIGLGNPEFAGSQFGQSYLANALLNHAGRSGDVNFLDRASSSLLAILPTSSVQVRADLASLRKQYLPR